MVWEEDIPLCSTYECRNNDGGECQINPKECPYLMEKK